jgi:hypothetical protein
MFDPQSKWMPSLFASGALALGGTTAQAAAMESPQAVTLEYRISKSGIAIGNVNESFTRTDDTYRIVSETRTAGPLKFLLKDKLTIVSVGRIGALGLSPTRYEFRRERDQHKNIDAEFDWNARQIVSRQSSTTENFELPEGTLDRVSAMYQFMFAAPATDTVTAWMSQGKKAEQYRYHKVGDETIHLAGRSFATVRYAREVKAGEAKAELWLAKNYRHLPVKMVFVDRNGMSLEQTLVALTLE